MKKLILISFFFALFAFQTRSQEISIAGTWKQVCMEIIENGRSTTNVTNSRNGEQLKSWSKEYFLFAGKTINHNEVSRSFGNGTYSLVGNNYTEDINVHVSPNYEGIKLKLHLEIKGDTLIQIFPVKYDWTYDKSNCWIEKFVRVE